MTAAVQSLPRRLSREQLRCLLHERGCAVYGNRFSHFAAYYSWAWNRMHAQGSGCRPSVRDAAAAVGISERTVKRFNAIARELSLFVVGPDERRRCLELRAPASVPDELRRARCALPSVRRGPELEQRLKRLERRRLEAHERPVRGRAWGTWFCRGDSCQFGPPPRERASSFSLSVTRAQKRRLAAAAQPCDGAGGAARDGIELDRRGPPAPRWPSAPRPRRSPPDRISFERGARAAPLSVDAAIAGAVAEGGDINLAPLVGELGAGAALLGAALRAAGVGRLGARRRAELEREDRLRAGGYNPDAMPRIDGDGEINPRPLRRPLRPPRREP